MLLLKVLATSDDVAVNRVNKYGYSYLSCYYITFLRKMEELDDTFMIFDYVMIMLVGTLYFLVLVLYNIGYGNDNSTEGNTLSDYRRICRNGIAGGKCDDGEVVWCIASNNPSGDGAT